MAKKRKAKDRMLEWRESRTAKNQDELRLGDKILATLRWEGLLSKRAFGASPEGQWTFDRPGLLSRDVKVWTGEGDAPVAVLGFGWTGDATLELADGRIFRWASTNFWQTRWAFTDGAGTPFACFADNSGFLERRTVVEAISSELSAPDRALLVLLGRYLMVLQSEDAAAGAAAATGGAVAAVL
jgi:hypothetical protein